VKIISNRRNNSLLVIARPADITYIKGLVATLDRESTDTNFLQRKLRYMPGVEFLQVARDALSRDNDNDIDSEGKCKGASGSNAATSCRRTSSIATFMFRMMWKRSSTCRAWGICSAITLR
jgi:hypothetical protein